MVKLSKVSKLDGIRSWSLEARKTCPGAFAEKGELVPACQGCYATQGNYRYPNVREPRAYNKEDWKRDNWVQDMVRELDNDRYFRWFDSGDVYHPELARKIFQVMQQTPWIKHWLPTRSHKIAKIYPILEAMKTLPNVSVRYSSDNVDGSYDKIHGSTILPFATKKTKAKVCEAYKHEGKCKGCRACWDKSVPVIGYVAHGRTMTKVIKLYASK